MDFHFLYLLFTFGYVFSTGLFNPGGIVILLAFFFLACIYRPRLESLTNLKSLLILSLTLTIFFDRILYPSFALANHLLKAGFVGAFILSLSFFYQNRFFQPRYTFPVLIFLALLLRIFIIFASPAPHTDVYYLIKEAPQFLIQGINPYFATYTRVYPLIKPDYYSYLPMSIFFFLPFSVIFHDPRWLYFFVYLALILLILKQKGNWENVKLCLLLILYQPLSFLVFEQGFLEILLLGLFGSVLLLLQNKRWSMAISILGIALATKQTIILALPFFIPHIYKKASLNKAVIMLFFPIILTLIPFLLWNFQAFWYDGVYTLLHMDAIRFDLVDLSLNVITLFHKITHFNLSSISLYPFIVLSLLYFGAFRLSRSHKLDSAYLSWSLVIFFLGFHLFATQAYINYFYLIGNLMIISQILAKREIKKTHTI